MDRKKRWKAKTGELAVNGLTCNLCFHLSFPLPVSVSHLLPHALTLSEESILLTPSISPHLSLLLSSPLHSGPSVPIAYTFWGHKRARLSSPAVITPGLCPWCPSFFPIVGDKIMPLCHHQTGCTSVWFNTVLHQFADALYFRGMHQDYKSSAFQRLFNINTDPTPEKIDGRVWSCRLFPVFSLFFNLPALLALLQRVLPWLLLKSKLPFCPDLARRSLCCSAVPAYRCPRRPAPFWKAAAPFL